MIRPTAPANPPSAAKSEKTMTPAMAAQQVLKPTQAPIIFDDPGELPFNASYKGGVAQFLLPPRVLERNASAEIAEARPRWPPAGARWNALFAGEILPSGFSPKWSMAAKSPAS